jgi:hypothetical protein
MNLKLIHPPLIGLMKECNMEIIYEIEDYIMGRETPGQVNFAKLATTEILIDTTVATETSVGIKLVVRNYPSKSTTIVSRFFPDSKP